MLFFCRRGRENLRELQKDSYSFGEGSSGRRYVFKRKDELTKNRREDSEAQEGGLMFELRGNPKCPVQSFEKYLSKLNPDCHYLFQRPKKEPKNSIWYDKQCIGKTTRGAKMKEISLRAKLSKIYTNHSVRATSVTILDECGFEARHIMYVSRHQNESIIRSYASKTNDAVKQATSVGLSSALSEKAEDEQHIVRAVQAV